MKRARRFAGRMLAAALAVAVVLPACSNSGEPPKKAGAAARTAVKSRLR